MTAKGCAGRVVAVALALVLAVTALFIWLGPGHARRGYSVESSTIGDLRMFVSAQAAYQSANMGFYDKPECLHRPSECLPGYDGPTFLDAGFLQEIQRGYRREFHPGRVAATTKAEMSPSSLETWALVAVHTRGIVLGYRSFCTDSTGALCFTVPSGRPRVSRGACVVEAGAPPSAMSRWLRGLFDDPPAAMETEEPCYQFR